MFNLIQVIPSREIIIKGKKTKGDSLMINSDEITQSPTIRRIEIIRDGITI